MKMTKKQGLVFEIVWYSLCGAIALWGLTYIILGLLAKYLPILSNQNPLVAFDTTIKNLFGLDSLSWGLILLASGSLLAIIVLLSFAKNADRSYDKSLRRRARLSHLEETKDETVSETTKEE